MIRTGQPYARVVATFVPHVEQNEDGPPTVTFEDTHMIYGHTLEEQLVPSEDDTADPNYELGWQEIEVGAAAALADAHEMAAEWRGSLVGQYAVR